MELPSVLASGAFVRYFVVCKIMTIWDVTSNPVETSAACSPGTFGHRLVPVTESHHPLGVDSARQACERGCLVHLVSLQAVIILNGEREQWARHRWGTFFFFLTFRCSLNTCV